MGEARKLASNRYLQSWGGISVFGAHNARGVYCMSFSSPIAAGLKGGFRCIFRSFQGTFESFNCCAGRGYDDSVPEGAIKTAPPGGRTA